MSAPRDRTKLPKQEPTAPYVSRRRIEGVSVKPQLAAPGPA